MSFGGSSLADIVARLEASMQAQASLTTPAEANGVPVPHFIGAEGSAAATNIERVVWVPTKRRDVPLRYSAESIGHAVAEKQTTCEVTIYASEWGRLEELADALRSALDAVLGTQGFEPNVPGEITSPGATGAGYALTCTYVVKAPVFAEAWRPGHVATTSFGINVDTKQGGPVSTLTPGS